MSDPVVAAIRGLNPADPGHWTRSGKPRCSVLSRKVGRTVSSRERDRAWAAVRMSKGSPMPAPSPDQDHQSAKFLASVQGARVKVSGQNVVDALRRSGLRKLRPFLLDSVFDALPLSIWQAILKWSDVDRMAYVAESRDCDNFAVALAGQVSLRLGINGCGIVVDYSGRHAYNCILVTGGDGDVGVMVVEPQSDRMPKVGDRLSGHEAYKAEQGFILLA